MASTALAMQALARVGANRSASSSTIARAALRLFPIPNPPLPARVVHVVVEPEDAGTSLKSFLASRLGADVDETYASELLDVGAVWFADVQPPRTLRGVPRTERARRLSGEDAQLALSLGNYLRIHVQPKRFPAAFSVDWEACVLENKDDYIVAHKPAQVSVVPTVDNVRESCLAMLERATGLETGTLKPLHRLDVGTEGVLVLGKTSAFAKEFGDMLAKRQVVKIYRVLTMAPLPLGVHIHDAVAATEGPRRMLLTEVNADDIDLEIARVAERGSGERGGESGPKRCILRVLACDEVSPDKYETRVELLTGRTHQIRAQFAALGAPLVGETLYRAPDDATSEVRVLHPEERLGLAASELHVKEDCKLGSVGTVFRAFEPWWMGNGD